MAGKVHLTVSMPTRTVLDIEADYVLLRTPEGDMGVLHGHEPCAVMLEYGVLRAYQNKEATDIVAVLGGFATVQQNRVTVLTTLAEHPERIDEAIAELERQRAEDRAREQKSDLEIQRAETALRRTLVQMDLSPHAILKGQDDIRE